MHCFQCQEAKDNVACTVAGMCGKKATTANLEDLLIYTLKGIAVRAEANGLTSAQSRFVNQAIFTTITNANFDDTDLADFIVNALELRDSLPNNSTLDCATWTSPVSGFGDKASTVGILQTNPNEDVIALRELAVYGLKGACAYAEHAAVLGYESQEFNAFVIKCLASTTKELSVEDMIAIVMECGKESVTAMALLDKANTETYGNPEVTEVELGVKSNPGILVSGHDLKDLELLLEQTKGTGVDVYTHSEMLPAHSYPKFKTYDNLVANYGGAWFDQGKEFTSFNGPILMTTNCITPVKQAYKHRIFTTGEVAYPEVVKIPVAADGSKDFSQIIELAKTCPAPTQIEEGKVVGGFAHGQVLALADKVVEAVKSGAIKRFVVMAGCDGRSKERNYFTEVAKALPEDAVILTAGCAKYRYNKLELGDIGGIPRVLDAGQCNDSYSLAVIAMKLQEVFGLEDINELPLSYDIAWYEQKAICVLLALLHLGFKGIRVGPTLPAFLSPNVAKVLIDTFDLKCIGDVEEDIANMMQGK